MLIVVFSQLFPTCVYCPYTQLLNTKRLHLIRAATIGALIDYSIGRKLIGNYSDYPFNCLSHILSKNSVVKASQM